MARKPSFEFERRERTKEKAAKRAEKAKAKSGKKSEGESTAPTAGGAEHEVE